MSHGGLDLSEAYGRVYAGLSELREVFHRSGRLDDANAKLDEIAKLFASYVADRTGANVGFPQPSDSELLSRLADAFTKTAQLPAYQVGHGKSIFGASPALALREGDETLASQLVTVVRQAVDDAFSVREAGHPFDLLNEAFGHFVRDNFRGNIEDAQYLTPPEVVQFMARLVLFDLLLTDIDAADAEREWIFMDPTCGVGSFLTAVHDLAPESGWLDRERVHLVGQDKVDRMVRLATINLQMFGVGGHFVSQGDSASAGTPLDKWVGRVDVILTNPPFGAKIAQGDTQEGTPVAPYLSTAVPQGSVDSELFFLERNLAFLRDGGRMLIVLPDGVVSARGLAATLRRHLQDKVTIRALIELPATTFAQAGTRTKTVILYLQKSPPRGDESALVAVVEDLGFEVSSRKGVLQKRAEGHNELPDVLDAWRRACSESESGSRVLSETPSIVVVSNQDIWRDSWTPRHFSAHRMQIVGGSLAGGVQMIPLDRLVEFVGGKAVNNQSIDNPACISVKHVLGEGFLDIHAALAYRPKTPGLKVSSGDLLLSKINPRIPRVCIVPDLGRSITCSSEFEIMRMLPDAPISLHALAYLLLSQVVQRQIGSLTSGTSSSHNRIRTSELAQVLIPIPDAGTELEARLAGIAADYERAVEMMNAAAIRIAQLCAERGQLLGLPASAE